MLDKPSAVRLAKSIRLFGCNAFAAARAERGERYLFDRMWVPKNGDLVFEMSTAARCKDDDKHVDAVGYLLNVSKDTDEKGNSEQVFRILTLDGREARWTDAMFMALPEERIFERDPGPPHQVTSTEKRYISDAEDILFDIEEQDRLDAGILTNVKRDSINMMREFKEISITDEERVIWIAKNYLLSCDDVRRALVDGPDYDQEKCQKETDEARKSLLPRKYLSFSKGRK